MGVSYFYLFLVCLFWVFLFPFYFIYLIKMKELETLLNSLIKRGWMPFWKEANYVEIRNKVITISREDFFEDGSEASLRDIVSLESGIWQFVCQNKLLSDKVDLQDYIEDSFWFRRCPRDSNWSYRLMRVAFVGEEDLEKFLIDNIKL